MGAVRVPPRSYDGYGRRVKRVDGSTGAVVQYIYDGDDLALEVDGSGNLLREYTYYPGIDQPHSMRQWAGGAGGAIHYYVLQQPGHVHGLVNANDQLVNEYRYTPFGTPVSAYPVEGTQNPLQYMARELDAATGMYYVRNRWSAGVVDNGLAAEGAGIGNFSPLSLLPGLATVEAVGTAVDVCNGRQTTETSRSASRTNEPSDPPVRGRRDHLGRCHRAHAFALGYGRVPLRRPRGVSRSWHDLLAGRSAVSLGRGVNGGYVRTGASLDPRQVECGSLRLCSRVRSVLDRPVRHRPVRSARGSADRSHIGAGYRLEVLGDVQLICFAACAALRCVRSGNACW